jgi:hypothetical protein
MLTLCPHTPPRSLIQQYIGDALVTHQLEDEGRIFYDGTYRVGKNVQPGTYYVRNVEGCYWERTDNKGNTIDNNFVTGASRVEVTIQSSDYSFNSDGCGQWQPVE